MKLSTESLQMCVRHQDFFYFKKPLVDHNYDLLLFHQLSPFHAGAVCHHHAVFSFRSLFLPANLGRFEVPSKKQHYALREQNDVAWT
ncbi:hypothetical protein [Hoylesella buccalis]|uniref:hypothetical protein n=1 Tax=Hoylesella buccalis TaxID=28127 RepID=UPI0012E05D55|nr:hypothetical protein [Hoylesella buccalis]